MEQQLINSRGLLFMNTFHLPFWKKRQKTKLVQKAYVYMLVKMVAGVKQAIKALTR